MLVFVLMADGGAGLPAHVWRCNGGEGKVEDGVVILSCRYASKSIHYMFTIVWGGGGGGGEIVSGSLGTRLERD